MTSNEIVDGILQREGGWRPRTQRPDNTWDEATNFGITLTTYRKWEDNPSLSESDLRGIDRALARTIYVWEYMDQPGFTEGNIPYEPLRVQLIDFGVTSGPARAVRWLQRVLGLPVTGVMDPITRDAMYEERENYQDEKRPQLAIINDALVTARCEMIREALAAGHIAKSDELGLLRRAISFTLAKS